MKEWLTWLWEDPLILLHVLFTGVLAAVLLWIAVEARRLGRRMGTAAGTSIADWDQLGSRIRTLRQQDVEHQDVGPVTKHALRLVLSESGGYGNLGLIPRALDLVRRPFDDLAASYRALGGMSVLVGLVYSVFVFVVIFFSLQKNLPAGNSSHFGAVLDVLKNSLFWPLAFLYLCNGFALFLGFVLQWKARRVADLGEAVEAAAADVLLQLEASPSEGLDPRIARAIRQLVEEFRSVFESVQNDFLHRLDSVSERMDTLGEQFAELLEKHGAIVRPLDGIDAVLRAVCEGQDNLAKGMKLGLQAIAEPLGLWRPAMDELRSTVGALREAAERLRPEELEKGQQEVRERLEQLLEAVREVGGQVKRVAPESLAPVLNSLESLLHEVQKVLRQLAERPVMEPGEMQRLLGEIGESLAQIHVAIGRLGGAPEDTRRQLGEMLEVLKQIRERRPVQGGGASGQMHDLVLVLRHLEEALRGRSGRPPLGGIV